MANKLTTPLEQFSKAELIRTVKALQASERKLLKRVPKGYAIVAQSGVTAETSELVPTSWQDANKDAFPWQAKLPNSFGDT